MPCWKSALIVTILSLSLSVFIFNIFLMTRYDWHQTVNHVVLSIYCKNSQPELSFLEANQVLLNINISFNQGINQFKKTIVLEGVSVLGLGTNSTELLSRNKLLTSDICLPVIFAYQWYLLTSDICLPVIFAYQWYLLTSDICLPAIFAYQRYLLYRFVWLPPKCSYKMCVFWLVLCFTMLTTGNIISWAKLSALAAIQYWPLRW